MKLNVLALIMLCVAMTSQAQNDSVPDGNLGKNEFKLNAPFLLAGILEPSYERNLNEDASVGVSVLIPIDKNLDADLNYYVSPYYRIFFGKKYAAGFFLEGFGMLNSVDEREDYYDANYNYVFEDTTITDFALGFGLGGKWLTTGGFVFEINGGIGRNLFNNSEDRDYTIVGKLGFNLGYRF